MCVCVCVCVCVCASRQQAEDLTVTLSSNLSPVSRESVVCVCLCVFLRECVTVCAQCLAESSAHTHTHLRVCVCVLIEYVYVCECVCVLQQFGGCVSAGFSLSHRNSRSPLTISQLCVFRVCFTICANIYTFLWEMAEISVFSSRTVT